MAIIKIFIIVALGEFLFFIESNCVGTCANKIVSVHRYKLDNCAGRLIRDTSKPFENQFRVTGSHNHAPDARVQEKAAVIDNIKAKAKSTSDRPRTIISSACDGVGVATGASLPKTSSLVRTINRIRNDNATPDPTNLTDLQLSDEHTKYNEEQFLLYDSGPGDDRILIFTTQRNQQLLKTADVWLMDGTFDVVPTLFKQLYTIQGE